jgi:cytochrome c oxidase subunit II
MFQSQIIRIFLIVFLGFSACSVRNPRQVAANVPLNRTPDIILDVTAQKYKFVPEKIRVRKGQLVELRLTSTDTKHGFELKAYGIRAELLKGQSVAVRFLAGQIGEFSFQCAVFCGLGHFGMDGKLIVE